jgi:hypothetical protein
MTFAEIVIFILVGIGIFYLLRPLQHRLENWFYKIFKTKKSKSNPSPVIDITNYKKKDKDDGKFQ